MPRRGGDANTCVRAKRTVLTNWLGAAPLRKTPAAIRRRRLAHLETTG